MLKGSKWVDWQDVARFVGRLPFAELLDEGSERPDHLTGALRQHHQRIHRHHRAKLLATRDPNLGYFGDSFDFAA